MHAHTVIVGAGPGGLACARILAEQGLRPLVLERKKKIGDKVCAGGITWGGLISRVPPDLAEKSFPEQHIITRFQKVMIKEKSPIIATVNRVKLGTHMAEQARAAGAEIMTGRQVKTIRGQTLVVAETENGRPQEITFDHLVGADGSNSLVRRHLGLASNRMGVGLNCQISGDLPQMEWHLNSRFFSNGYGWIFPHKNTVSIGAYIPSSVMAARRPFFYEDEVRHDGRLAAPALRLKEGLLAWAGSRGLTLEQKQIKAGHINYDYQGWRFGRIFLVGDAAGLASGLTGEGIYPAIISGEEAARSIIDPDHSTTVMERLIDKHRLHSRVVEWTGRSPAVNIIAGECVTLGLRCGLIRFSKLEMAV